MVLNGYKHTSEGKRKEWEELVQLLASDVPQGFTLYDFIQVWDLRFEDTIAISYFLHDLAKGREAPIQIVGKVLVNCANRGKHWLNLYVPRKVS